MWPIEWAIWGRMAQLNWLFQDRLRYQVRLVQIQERIYWFSLFIMYLLSSQKYQVVLEQLLTFCGRLYSLTNSCTLSETTIILPISMHQMPIKLSSNISTLMPICSILMQTASSSWKYRSHFYAFIIFYMQFKQIIARCCDLFTAKFVITSWKFLQILFNTYMYSYQLFFIMFSQFSWISLSKMGSPTSRYSMMPRNTMCMSGKISKYSLFLQIRSQQLSPSSMLALLIIISLLTKLKQMALGQQPTSLMILLRTRSLVIWKRELKLVIRIEVITARVSGRFCSFYDSTVSTMNEMSSFCYLDRSMNSNVEQAYLAILRIYESDSDDFSEPVMKITHSYVMLLNASSMRFTKVFSRFDARILMIGDDANDQENYYANMTNFQGYSYISDTYQELVLQYMSKEKANSTLLLRKKSQLIFLSNIFSRMAIVLHSILSLKSLFSSFLYIIEDSLTNVENSTVNTDLPMSQSQAVKVYKIYIIEAFIQFRLLQLLMMEGPQENMYRYSSIKLCKCSDVLN